MEAGTQKNYTKILDGTEKSLVILPDNVYHFGSGKDNAVLHIQLILDKIDALEQHINSEEKINPNPTSQTDIEKMKAKKHEKENMHNFMQGVLTEKAEAEIYQRFHELLHNEIGCMIHGYLPETYLQKITDRAKSQRKSINARENSQQNLNMGFTQLTALELKLQEVLGIRTIVSDEADDIVSKVRAQNGSVLKFTSEILRQSIGKQGINKQKCQMIVNSIVSGRDYTELEARRIISVGLTHFYANKSGEMDFLIVLVEYQVIINVEVKYQLNKLKDQKKQAHHLLSAASTQVNSHDEYITRTHGNIFSNGWNFLKISAIVPGVSLDSSELCQTCPKTIITSDVLKSKESFSRWFEGLGMEKTYIHQVSNPLPDVYLEYTTFIRRIIGSMNLVPFDESSWQKVMGKNFKSSINPDAFTESQPTPSTSGKASKKSSSKSKGGAISGTAKHQPTTDSFSDMKNRPMDAEKSIYLTCQQGPILLTNSVLFLKTILFGDFGSGKNEI